MSESLVKEKKQVREGTSTEQEPGVLVKSQEMEFRAHQVYGKPLTPLKLEKT